MKTKAFTVVAIGIFLYACSGNESNLENLESITEQNNLGKTNLIVEEEIEMIFEQEGGLDSINEKDEFYRYKLLIEEMDALTVQQNNITKKK